MRFGIHGYLGLLVVAGVLAGCGGEEGGEGGAGGSESTGKGSGAGKGSGSGNSYTCCINDAFYLCPNKAAFDQCAGFDIDGCMSACSFDDFECQDACFASWTSSDHDPSACEEDPAGTCGDTGGVTSGGATSGGATSGSGPSGSTSSGGCQDESAFCEYDLDCCSNVCTDGFCQESDTTCLHDGGFCETGFDCCSLDCIDGFCVGG